MLSDLPHRAIAIGNTDPRTVGLQKHRAICCRSMWSHASHASSFCVRTFRHFGARRSSSPWQYLLPSDTLAVTLTIRGLFWGKSALCSCAGPAWSRRTLTLVSRLQSWLQLWRRDECFLLSSFCSLLPSSKNFASSAPDSHTMSL